MLPDSPDPATDHAEPHGGAVQRTCPVDVRNHNRQKRTPKLRHRRPDLHGRIPPTMRAIAMTDRGLRSPKLWKKIHSFGWRPYMRRRIDTVFRIDGGKRMPARSPVSAPGRSFIGRGTAFRAKSKRLSREYNHHPGRESGRAEDYPDRPRGGVVARDALLDRNGIQCAEKRGLAVAKNTANRPRAGGAALAGFVGRDAADARLRQPRGGRQCAETESERASVAAESGA